MRSTALALFCCMIAACSFEAPSSLAAIESNTCTTDDDCAGARCENGMCAASRAVDELEVVLEVTPLPMVGSGSSVPITLGPFPVTGPTDKAWPLTAPAVVRGRVREGESIVEADVSFVAGESLPGLAPRMVSATVSMLGGADADYDYEVTLPSRGNYRMVLQPKDPRLPPLRWMVEVTDDLVQSVDFATRELTERTYAIANLPEGRELLVHAVDSDGALISSAGHIEDGSVTLLFDSADTDYRLVVRAEETYDEADVASNDADCDHETPVLPTFSIASADIQLDHGIGQLSLPAAPTRVRYEGRIELCEAPSVADMAPASLPVALRSSAIDLDRSESDLEAWSAELALDTDATYDDDTRSYKFCLDVMPGDYSVVVTPPTGLPCELFADQRLIRSPDGEETATAPLLKLSTATTMTGTLRTFDGMAVPSAVIDMRSRSLGDAVVLEADDASLTNYNRSRQVISDASGQFSVPVDVGSYDLTIKPPVGSGFSWFVKRDVTIGARGADLETTIEMGSPIVVECSIGYADGSAEQALLAGAEVTAYALIEDEATAGKRAVAIGQAVADEQGHFTLLLPSVIPTGW